MRMSSSTLTERRIIGSCRAQKFSLLKETNGKQEIHQHQRGCPTDATAGSGGICDTVHTFQGSECEKNLLKARWAEI